MADSERTRLERAVQAGVEKALENYEVDTSGLEERVRAQVSAELEKYGASLASHAGMAAKVAAENVSGDLAGNFEELEEHVLERLRGEGERIRVAVKAEVASEVRKNAGDTFGSTLAERARVSGKRSDPEILANSLMSGSQPGIQRLRAWIMDLIRDHVKTAVKDEFGKVAGITSPAKPSKENPQGLRSFSYSAYGQTAGECEQAALAEGYRRFGDGAKLRVVLQSRMFPAYGKPGMLYAPYEVFEEKRAPKSASPGGRPVLAYPGMKRSYLVTSIYGESREELEFRAIAAAREKYFGYQVPVVLGDYTVHDNKPGSYSREIAGRLHEDGTKPLFIDHVLAYEEKQ